MLVVKAEWRFSMGGRKGHKFWWYITYWWILIRLMRLYQVSNSWELLEIFKFSLTGIFSKFLFKGLSLFLLWKILFFYQDAFVAFLGLIYLHLIIDLLHKHHFRFSLFRRLFAIIFFLIDGALTLSVDPSSALSIHRIINLYPHEMKIFPTVNVNSPKFTKFGRIMEKFI